MNSKTETMLDEWNDAIEVQSVIRSVVTGYGIVYLNVFSGKLYTIAILDLEKLDQLIVLLQNARQRITEE